MTSIQTIRMTPSLLDADFGRLAEEIAAVEQAGADMLHLDVMDGHFVPNISLGVPVVAGVRRHTRLPLDVHLMISDPEKYAAAFVDAGASLLTFHIEAVPQPTALIRKIRGLGVRVGLSLNPPTPVESVLQYVSDVDLVLVMTVHPGFGGQKFMTECLPKLEVLAKRMRPEQFLQVDGGINVETAPQAVAAGANTLVAGKAIFGAPDKAEALRKLRAAATRTGGVEEHGAL
jgi:ribulose-phosphate 3-epimerase